MVLEGDCRLPIHDFPFVLSNNLHPFLGSKNGKEDNWQSAIGNRQSKWLA
jgi:hypothetical protein